DCNFFDDMQVIIDMLKKCQGYAKTRLKKCNMLKGVRQCGKTFSVRQFAGENYIHVVYIDFYEQPEAKVAFQSFKKVDDIVMNITAIVPGATFIPGQPCQPFSLSTNAVTRRIPTKYHSFIVGRESYLFQPNIAVWEHIFPFTESGNPTTFCG
ncbi:MAG: AAA family ATPase, partial [Bacteroidales bacterium]|nr:AAA family ATPase [Bacteroidales bacterium]